MCAEASEETYEVASVSVWASVQYKMRSFVGTQWQSDDGPTRVNPCKPSENCYTRSGTFILCIISMNVGNTLCP